MKLGIGVLLVFALPAQALDASRCTELEAGIVARQPSAFAQPASGAAPDAATASTEFATRFAPIHAQIFAYKPLRKRFRQEEAWQLLPLARAAGACSPELAKLTHAIALTYYSPLLAKDRLYLAETALEMSAANGGLHPREREELHFYASSEYQALHREAPDDRDSIDKGLAHARAGMALMATRKPQRSDTLWERDLNSYWLMESGDYKAAYEADEVLLPIVRRHGNTLMEIATHDRLGDSQRRLGNPRLALEHKQRALRVAKTYYQVPEAKRLLIDLTALSRELGDQKSAEEFTEELRDLESNPPKAPRRAKVTVFQ
jgi:tetratricopeptide (TPR) repeat protein